MMRNTILVTLLSLLACKASADPGAAAVAPAMVTSPVKTETAIVAGGCFWGMENVMRQAPGIVSIEVGYAGGKSTNVHYEDVETGDTGHAESVRIVFDPTKISYA